jgi:outer membrane receptor protein involved in Fe transport
MMTKRNSKSRALTGTRFAMTPLAAAVVAAMNPGSVALAQDDDKRIGIEEIIVTATKREMSIQDVAQSITAFSTAEIERRQLLDMADIAVNLPSITLSTTRAGRNELVYRGISNGGSWRLDSQVAMYLDEMPMTMSTTQLDARMVDIERVESLPGPQGTLFGSSSQAGTLRVVTNKPKFDAFAGSVTADVKSTTGGEESWDIHGYLNIPVSDNFAIRMVAYSNKEGGYIDNVYSTAPHSVCAPGAPCEHLGWDLPDGHLTGRTMDNAGLEENDYNDYSMTGGRISALWNMNEDWSLLTSLMFQDSETTGVWYSDTAIGDFKVARFSDEWRKDRWATAMLTLEGDLGFAVLTNSFGYADRTQTYHFDNTHYEAYHTRLKGGYFSAYCNYWNAYYAAYCSAYQFGEYNYYDKYHTGYNGGVYRSLQDAERITNELRLTSKGDSRFQWMVGAFYENNKDGWVDSGEIPNLDTTIHWAYTQFRTCDLVDQGFPVDCPPEPVNDIWYIDDYAREITQLAAFGEFSYDLTDKLTATVGLRWFEYDRLVVSDQQWPPGLPVEGILLEGESAFVEEGTESDTSFKLGLSYDLSDDKMLYALYSEGFRLGGNNNAKAVRVNFVEETYDPDKLFNYEAGIKSQWLDNRLTLNATAFYMEWEDIQLVIGSDSALWWLVGQANGGGGRNAGIEVAFDWVATQRLRLSGSVYAGDPYYTADFITLEGVQEVTDGTRMPDSAKKKYHLAADYTIPNVFRGGDLWMRYDYYHVGDMFSALWRAEEANPNAPPDSDGDPVYDPDARPNVDSYSTSNFQVGYSSADGGWHASLMVRNLLDERVNTFSGCGDACWYAVNYWGHPGFGDTNNLARPRTYSLRLTKNF